MDLQIKKLLVESMQMPDPRGQLRQELKLLHELMEKRLSSRSYFVTINWAPQHEVTSLQTVLAKLLSKKWIREHYFSHEQRGETVDDMGKGYHVHLLLLNVDKSLFEVRREFFSTVKNYVGNAKHLDIQTVPYEWINDKKDYLRGVKKDSSKDLKLTIDDPFRHKYGLKNRLPAAAPPPTPSGGDSLIGAL